jgi:hypothetical protein
VDPNARLLISYLISLPAILVWLAVLVLAIVRWNRHPRISRWAALAAVLWLAQSLGGPILSTLTAARNLQIVIEIGRIITAAAAYGFIAVAVFAERDNDPTSPW